jgi:hypothetical protein
MPTRRLLRISTPAAVLCANNLAAFALDDDFCPALFRKRNTPSPPVPKAEHPFQFLHTYPRMRSALGFRQGQGWPG